MKEPIKKGLYPKTVRFGAESRKIFITEKLHGSNLGFFRLNDKLIVAQRGNIFEWTPTETNLTKNFAYNGLIAWLEKYGEVLIKSLNETSGVFGEWLGMGHKYGNRFENKFHIFAKANIYENEVGTYSVKDLINDRDYLHFPFVTGEIPSFLSVVPLVGTLDFFPEQTLLDDWYEFYKNKLRDSFLDDFVEGFVIVDGPKVQKYLRQKKGDVTPHEAFPDYSKK